MVLYEYSNEMNASTALWLCGLIRILDSFMTGTDSSLSLDSCLCLFIFIPLEVYKLAVVICQNFPLSICR
jgi:hypothetical protein